MQLLLLIVKKKQQQRRFLKIERAKFLWFRKWFFLPPPLSASGYSFHAWLFRSHGFNLSKLQKLVFCVISRPISFWRKKAKIIEIVHNFFFVFENMWVADRISNQKIRRASEESSSSKLNDENKNSKNTFLLINIRCVWVTKIDWFHYIFQRKKRRRSWIWLIIIAHKNTIELTRQKLIICWVLEHDK